MPLLLHSRCLKSVQISSLGTEPGSVMHIHRRLLTQTAVGIISPFEFANKASHFQNKFWENHDLTVQPVITYIYFCGRIYASCLSHFSNRRSVMDQKPKCKIGFNEPIKYLHLSYTDSWCVVPFSINNILQQYT
jgi:hypothetical protein